MFSTAMHDFLVKKGARFDEKGGITQFLDNIEEEYNNVRSGFGIFIKSDKYVISIKGEGSQEMLDPLVTGNLCFLEYNHILFTAVTDTSGRIVDLVYIYRMQDRFLMMANNSQKDKLLGILGGGSFRSGSDP